MPCSCLSKKKNNFISVPTKQAGNLQFNPSQGGYTVSIIPKKSVIKDISTSTLYMYQDNNQQSDSYSLDFSATVKPEQLCILCAMKHVGFALMLLQQGGIQNRFLAIGQLLCARAHLKYNYKGSYLFFTDIIMHILLQENVQPQLKQFLDRFNKQRQEFSFKTTYYNNTQNIEKGKYLYSQLKYAVMPHLLLYYAYALVCMQPGYVTLNASYAVGALASAAFRFSMLGVNQNNDTVNRIRQIWKTLQVADQYQAGVRKITFKLWNLMTNLYISRVQPMLKKYKQDIDSIKKEM